jgi:two-component sensor histidine kinase
LAERGTEEFYREQAARMTALAVITEAVEMRLELLEMAAVFQRLADRAAVHREAPEAAKSA